MAQRLDLLDPVTGEQNTPTLAGKIGHQFVKFVGGTGVESVGRFIEQQELRSVSRRASQAESLPVPLRQLAGGPLRHFAKPVSGQMIL